MKYEISDESSEKFDRQKFLEMKARLFQIERAKREAETGIPETFTTTIDLSEIFKEAK